MQGYRKFLKKKANILVSDCMHSGNLTLTDSRHAAQDTQPQEDYGAAPVCPVGATRPRTASTRSRASSEASHRAAAACDAAQYEPSASMYSGGEARSDGERRKATRMYRVPAVVGTDAWRRPP